MPENDARIEQFKQMAQADPDNELGHFSLGRIYLESGRYDEAIAPLSRALELNPKLSKAYQLLGSAYEGAGQREKAIEIVTNGVTIADGQGDRMPRDAMAEMLGSWGASIPTFSGATPSEAVGRTGDAASAGFSCARCGRPGGQLAKAPFKGDLGRKIFEGACSSCWREWIAMGTKVINELGLVLSTREGQQTYDQYMLEFLQLEER